jgi:hypothetical protein
MRKITAMSQFLETEWLAGVTPLFAPYHHLLAETRRDTLCKLEADQEKELQVPAVDYVAMWDHECKKSVFDLAVDIAQSHEEFMFCFERNLTDEQKRIITESTNVTLELLRVLHNGMPGKETDLPL